MFSWGGQADGGPVDQVSLSRAGRYHSLERLLLWAAKGGEGKVKASSKVDRLGWFLVWFGRIWFGHTKLGPCLIEEPLVGFKRRLNCSSVRGMVASVELQIVNR